MTHPGVLATLIAATLFGAGTPLAKLLLAQTSPWLLTGATKSGSRYRVILPNALPPSWCDE